MRNLLKALSVVGLCLVFAAPSTSAARSQQPAGPHYFFVVFLNMGPKYDPALPLFGQPGIREHGAYMSQLEKEGKLLVGGPFVDKPGSLAATGAMMLILADSLDEARRMMAVDPAQTSGLLVATDIKPFVMTGGAWRR